MPWRISPSPSSILFSPVFLLSLFISINAYPVTSPPNPSCQNTTCGELDIAYPFWLAPDPIPFPFTVCGYLAFQLICQNNTPIISLDFNNYTVTQIDYSTQTIYLTDADFPAADDTCPRPRHNLTLLDTYFWNSTWLPEFPSLLNYTSLDVNLTFFLDCSSEDPKLDNQITCFQDRSYIFTDNNLSTTGENGSMLSCQSILVVPVLKEELDRINGSALSSDFGGVLTKGFQLGWLNKTWGECDQCELSGGRCGAHLISTNWAFACFCPNGESDHHCGHDNSKRKIIIEIFAALGLSLGCLFLLLYLLRYRKSKSHSKNAQIVEDFLCKYGSIVPKRYKYSEIKKMTNSFGHKIGQGGYGSVFKGNLNDGHPVAVKVLNEYKGNGEEFVNEVASISRTSHVNIVCLLGFCLERSKRALIYEFMPNGSLEKFIYGEIPNANIKLGWEKLYEITVGIARGLEYLHRGCNTRMVHFDIKPHNILLDQEFCPKISDFGLAKLCPPKESIISMVGARGTPGYIAPEVFLRNFGVVSSKSDVYSYGMMVLEMIGGRKNIDASAENTSEIYFPHWIYDHLDQYDALEAYEITNETEDIAKRMILVGLWCIQMLPADRPSMSRVLDMLEGKVSDLQIPPKP